MGKMLHQLVTANYYHFTLGEKRPPLRQMPAPGSHFRKLPNPGFRWNVLDYGGGRAEPVDFKRLITMAGNVFSRPLSTGKRCAGSRASWHCLWQRFPQQDVPPMPSAGTPVHAAALALYNLSLAGRRPDSLLQYLIVSGVTHVFTQPTPAVRAYIAEYARVVCHRGGPRCGGSADEQRTPIAALHVRHGDSCDRPSRTPGPWNAMFATNPTTGKLERVSHRYCYAWGVYRQALERLQKEYGVRTVLLATDDHTGELLRGLASDTQFNWVYLDYPRGQFKKRDWMEFRSDLDENAPFSLAAELELLSAGDVFVGNMGSHTSRMLYMKLVAAGKTGVLPPWISVDGYGLCCGFTDGCSKPEIRDRHRKIRSCIYSYGLATGGEQWFYHRG